MRIDTKHKLAGVLVPVFALRHDRDLGVGDTIAMRNAIEFCSDNGIGVLQILPINETGGDNSPYTAISSVALDPAYLSLTPDMVPGLTDEMVSNAVPDDLRRSLQVGSVQYHKVKQIKHELLFEAFGRFEKEATADQIASLQQFEKENQRWLGPYTLFRTLMDQHAGDARWTLWEPELQTYEQARQTVLQRQDARAVEGKRKFWSYVQWVAYAQWRELKDYAQSKTVQLMGDLPFGVGRYSVDVWSERELFDLDWSCGAPPEKFFQGDAFTREWGQNWGMPLYKWPAHEKENYAWWRQRVKHLNELFHYFRIDHVLGFFRVYAFPWIPERNQEFEPLTKEEAKKKTGGKLPHFIPRCDDEPEDALLNEKEGEAILKVLLEAAGSTGIVAEDLGMVPDYVRPLIHKLGIAGFAIPIFERIEETREFKPKETLPVLSLATYGTHDHQPLVTFYDQLVQLWHGPEGHQGWVEMQRLMRFLGQDENNPPTAFSDALHQTFLRILLETPCWLAVLMITDLLGTSQRFNEPGLSGDYNWSQRLDRPLTAYLDDPHYADKIRTFSELIKLTHRAPLVSARA